MSISSLEVNQNCYSIQFILVSIEVTHLGGMQCYSGLVKLTFCLSGHLFTNMSPVATPLYMVCSCTPSEHEQVLGREQGSEQGNGDSLTV